MMRGFLERRVYASKRMKLEVNIAEGTVKDCLEIMGNIPEFGDKRYDEADFVNRLSGVQNLILIAVAKNCTVGFKVGYKRDDDGSFYSWMGGVLPEFRRLRIAKKLADAQEEWAKKQGYTAITFKTRNYLKPMLTFALKNGFNIIDVIAKEKITNHRIILKKLLNE